MCRYIVKTKVNWELTMVS
uniref:Uncharacterized protein n=1 Tax=Anguilla anguilla TaxID=7936 RepID=A0A0E9VT45_ANGAN